MVLQSEYHHWREGYTNDIGISKAHCGLFEDINMSPTNDIDGSTN